MRTAEQLEQQVRESGALVDRLGEAITRISKMCSESRPPKMTIPVQWYDDDFFISTTIRDAIRAMTKNEQDVEIFPVTLEGVEREEGEKENG